MFKQIKDLMTIKEEISSLSKEFVDTRNSVKAYSEEIKLFRKDLDELKKSELDLCKCFKEDSMSIKEVKEELKKEITDFKLAKSRLEHKMLDQFDEELKNELRPRFERLDKSIKEFQSAEEKIIALSKRVNEISVEIEKFSSIAKSIKKEDFELTKFAGQLKQADSEKLELLRKIDTLERLISKMRQRSQ